MTRPLMLMVAVAVLTLVGGCGEATGGTDSFPAPPQGSRWVGLGQVVVAVPDWWTTGETRCRAPIEDTVYFDQGVVADCADPADVREVSALAVFNADTGYGEAKVRTMRRIGVVHGREVVERPTCESRFHGVCRRLFAVPSEGVLFAVTIDEEGDGDYETIRDSLQILPDEVTTVPLATRQGQTPTWGAEPPVTDALIRQLEDAGLRVEVETVERSEDDGRDYASMPTGSLLAVSPELGSVIDVGGTVTVTVSGQSMAPAR